MSNKILNDEDDVAVWKNEATRQRWQLFHSAIAHAKQSNAEAMAEKDRPQQPDSAEPADSRAEPQLSIAR
ncbi:MAG: hypothetical protein WD448_10735 [Woeseia sp.]